MMDTQRLILILIFSFSLLMLWEAWQKENRPQPPAPAAQAPAAVPAPGKPAASRRRPPWRLARREYQDPQPRRPRASGFRYAQICSLRKSIRWAARSSDWTCCGTARARTKPRTFHSLVRLIATKRKAASLANS